jgi:hypothetical protein
VKTNRFKFTTERHSPTIVLSGPDDGTSVNAYITAAYAAAFPIIFTWVKITEVTAYTLKLSSSNDFVTPGAVVEYNVGDNNSYSLDQNTCDGLMAAAITTAGINYTGKVSFQWTVEPSAGQPSGIGTQTRTLVTIGGESGFPYELNDDGLNMDGWTVTASVPSKGDNVPGNILLGVAAGTDYTQVNAQWWECTNISPNHTLGDMPGHSFNLLIDMLSVKTITKITERIKFYTGNAIIAVSTDGTNYTNIGTLDFPQSNYNIQPLELTDPVEARYIRLTTTKGWGNTAANSYWTSGYSISRVWVYGSNNGE